MYYLCYFVNGRFSHTAGEHYSYRRTAEERKAELGKYGGDLRVLHLRQLERLSPMYRRAYDDHGWTDNPEY